MSSLLNLPFSLSFNSQSFKKLLQYRINIQSNSNEDTWSEKAIKGLVKRLTKTSMIDDLQTSLETKNSETRCVTIRRYNFYHLSFVSFFLISFLIEMLKIV